MSLHYNRFIDSFSHSIEKGFVLSQLLNRKISFNTSIKIKNKNEKLFCNLFNINRFILFFNKEEKR